MIVGAGTDELQLRLTEGTLVVISIFMKIVELQCTGCCFCAFCLHQYASHSGTASMATSLKIR